MFGIEVRLFYSLSNVYMFTVTSVFLFCFIDSTARRVSSSWSPSLRHWVPSRRLRRQTPASSVSRRVSLRTTASHWRMTSPAAPLTSPTQPEMNKSIECSSGICNIVSAWCRCVDVSYCGLLLLPAMTLSSECCWWILELPVKTIC